MLKEALNAMDRARMRSYLTPQLREYLDSKEVSSSSQLVARVCEWKANTYDQIGVFSNPGGRRAAMGSQRKVARKPGECYLCGKPGHFAKECRSAR